VIKTGAKMMEDYSSALISMNHPLKNLETVSSLAARLLELVIARKKKGQEMSYLFKLKLIWLY
jgi:hypothetical protein